MSKTVTIDGVEYAPVVPAGNDIRICILERGWVVIGHYERSGDTCTVRNGAVIRVWGTTKGLPELVNGPTGKTVLDKCAAPIEFSVGAQIATLACNAEKWAGKL